MLKKMIAVMLTGMLVVGALGACSSNDTKEATSEAPASETGATEDTVLEGEKEPAEAGAEEPVNASDIKVGVIFTSAGLGGKSFNDLTFDGVKRAKEELGIDYDEVEPKSVSDEEIIQDEMADSGEYALIICVGFEQKDALTKVAANYPDQKFVILDAEVDAPNVASYLSKEEESSFLVGVLSALVQDGKINDMVNDKNTVGFIGGDDNALINKFRAGYEAGVKYVNPDIAVLSDYVGGFSDTATAKAIATTMNQKGADIIFHAAGAAGKGLFTAAEENKFMAIGVNSNQNEEAPDYIVASMLKNADVAAFHVIQDVIEGTFAPGQHILGLKEDGVGYTVEGSSIQVPAEIIAKVDEVKEKVISGEIVVPADPAEVESFIANNKIQ